MRGVCDFTDFFVICTGTNRRQVQAIADNVRKGLKKFGKALDEIRAEEVKRLKRDGYEPVLKRSRWCFLKRPENLTEKQTVKLSELLKYNLRTVRAYLLREDFQRFWEYRSPGWAVKFLDEWCIRTMRSKIAPMKKIVGTLREHRDLILNWFRAKGTVSAGSVEGLNISSTSLSASGSFRSARAALAIVVASAAVSIALVLASPI